MKEYEVIIIGAGAAGLMCAIEAGRRGRKVVVLEHNGSVGRKIAISGGGRCNFTNTNTRPENFISANPHFCKSALARYTPQDFINLVKKHRIAYYEKKLGQLFCVESAGQIIQMLLDESAAAGVEIRLNCEVKAVTKDGLFRVETNQGVFSADSLVIATGGLSIPKIGATDFGYRVARQFGLKIIETRPALAPLRFGAGEAEKLTTLSGVAVDATAKYGKVSFRENILVTHRGLSGPAILQISSYWRPGEEIGLDLLPELDAAELLRAARSRKVALAALLSQHLPQRFAQAWCALHAPARPLNQISDKELRSVAERLHDWRLRFNQTEGYAKAEVTAGGVDTRELSSQTMAARRVAGLYFIGEVVDVTGWLGGYNFQWAWASGFAAGRNC
jgi:predicted Rossmann fold flavoprotein